MSESTVFVLYAGLGLLTFAVLALATAVIALVARAKDRDKFIWTLCRQVETFDASVTRTLRTLTADIGIISQSAVEAHIASAERYGGDMAAPVHDDLLGALMFNAARGNIKAITAGDDVDFWEVVRELAEGLKPLSADEVEIDAEGNIYLGGVNFIDVERTERDTPATKVVEGLLYIPTPEGIRIAVEIE